MGASGRGKPLLFQIHLFSSYCVAQLHGAQWKAGRRQRRGPHGHSGPRAERSSPEEVLDWGL